MSERPPFDQARAVFWLVAFVVFVQMAVVVAGGAGCLLHGDDIVQGRWKCDADNRLFDLLGSALSAVLAFAAGRMSNHGDPPPPPPKE